MAISIKAKYLGDLRVECTHLGSNTTIITDAPLDNNGKGQSFSPTDLVATALASCAMTIIGIAAQTHHIDVMGTEIEITRTMATEPRRISAIDVVFHMPSRTYTDKEKTIIERAAHTCPVHFSLHQDMTQNFVFLWK